MQFHVKTLSIVSYPLPLPNLWYVAASVIFGSRRSLFRCLDLLKTIQDEPEELVRV